jgi:hypothetical protein
MQEGVRCSENRRLLRPLKEGVDVIRLYLEPIIDRDAMNAEECGGPLMPDIFVVGDRSSSPYSSSEDVLQDTAAERTLDLVSTPISDGKRKFCDNLLIPVDREGKRLRRLGGDALDHGTAFRAVIYAESRRLQDFLSPLIVLRGFTNSFIAQATDIIVRRNYAIDLSRLDLTLNNRLPFLNTEENTKLALLYQIFVQHGQSAVAMEVGDLLRLRFRDSHLLARLLRSDVFAAEDYVPIEGLGLVEEDVRETERMIGNARISTCVSPRANETLALQPLDIGARVPGPLARSHVTPDFLLGEESGRTSRLDAPAGGWFRPNGTRASASFRVYDGRGHSPPIRSPLSGSFRPRVRN